MSTVETVRGPVDAADLGPTLLHEEGYTSQIHLGHDAACFCDFMLGDPNFADASISYLHLSENILPQLLAAGVTQAEIDEMLTANAVRFLAR